MTAVAADDRNRLHRQIWAEKPVLQEVYGHLYRRMVAACRPGLTLEVGGGSGNLKSYAQDIVSFDIVPAPWLDFVADAQALPLPAASAANIVMLDVLHHIEYPVRFLREAERVLVPGGRLVMVEPGITPLSWPFYRFIHEEPVVMSQDPLAEGAPDPHKDPYAGNQAIPTRLATRDAARMHAAVPGLRLARVDWLSLLAYPLSGGFKRWSLITPALARAVLGIEDRIAPWLGRACAFRVMLVLEKQIAPTAR